MRWNNLKATGLVRKVDPICRIVLPMELRRTLHINEGDSMAIFVHNDTIILKKYEPACVFCDSINQIAAYKGKMVCEDCSSRLLAQLP